MLENHYSGRDQTRAGRIPTASTTFVQHIASSSNDFTSTTLRFVTLDRAIFAMQMCRTIRYLIVKDQISNLCCHNYSCYRYSTVLSSNKPAFILLTFKFRTSVNFTALNIFRATWFRSNWSPNNSVIKITVPLHAVLFAWITSVWHQRLPGDPCPLQWRQTWFENPIQAVQQSWTWIWLGTADHIWQPTKAIEWLWRCQQLNASNVLTRYLHVTWRCGSTWCYFCSSLADVTVSTPGLLGFLLAVVWKRFIFTYELQKWWCIHCVYYPWYWPWLLKLIR